MMRVACHEVLSEYRDFYRARHLRKSMRIIAVIADVVMAGICGRKRVGFLKWLGEARRFQIQANRWYLHCLATFLLMAFGGHPSIPELRNDEGR